MHKQYKSIAFNNTILKVRCHEVTGLFKFLVGSLPLCHCVHPLLRYLCKDGGGGGEPKISLRDANCFSCPEQL